MTYLTPNIDYSPETGYIMLDVAKPAGLPDTCMYDDTQYLARPHLHISLLDCRKTAANLQVDENEFVETFRDITRMVCLGAVTLRTPLYECRKVSEPMRTIVAKAEVIGLNALFEIVQSRRGREVPRPFPHVTLYTSDGGRGIAVRNAAMFADRCRKIDAPELEAVLAAR